MAQQPVDERRCRAARAGWPAASRRCLCWLAGEDEKDQAEHEGDVNAAMQWSPAAGRSRPCSSGSRRARTAATATSQPAAGSSGRNRISGSSSASSFWIFGVVGLCRRSSCQSPRGPASPSLMRARAGLLQQAGLLVEFLGARMQRDADAQRARSPCWITLPLAWPASSAARVLSLHSALVIS